MTTQIITISPAMLIDIEGAEIPYRPTVAKPIYQVEEKHHHNDYAVMRNGRIGKVFNRHAMTFR